MRINKFLPFAIIYFFLNTVGLPFGLTWMALMAPFFYVWVLLQRKKEILVPFLTLLLPFVIMHIAVAGVDLRTYILSFVNLTMVYIFCQAFYTFLKVCNDPEKIFRKILYINFVFCLIGLIFYFTSGAHFFWIEQELTKGVKEFRRFKLFTYEASYYATLFVPIFFFYLLQYIFRQSAIKNNLLLAMIFLPFVLSFSFGVISASVFAIVIAAIFYWRQFLVKRRVVNSIINIGFVTASAMVILVLFFRDNPLFIRMQNIFEGIDTSGKARTADSFMLALQMLEEKNQYWGIGIGHVKIVGQDIVRGYYLYTDDFVATIPNAMAETLAIFGWVGFILKLLIEIALFFYTKVWTNYYGLMLFFFIFIYQFTGSFITNMAEYAIWILAFTNVFRQFDVKKSQPKPLADSISIS